MKRAAASLLTGGALVLLGVLMGPAGPAEAAIDGVDGTSVDLYAVEGETTMPNGTTVPVWGYSTTGTPATAPGGPTLVVNEGQTVHVTLHNTLPEATGLLFQGQQLVPDRQGASVGGPAKEYSFVAQHAGTYLYEAALLPNAQHQVAMGLYGALVVRPATAGQAYANAASAFDEEAVLVLSEIDPALNGSADPSTFDMRNYAPRFFMVNGKAYPDTDPIPAAGNDKVLLRYVNAGIGYHSMAVLGAHQDVIALDGSPLTYARHFVADTFGPGQTADTIVTAPASAAGGVVPIFDGSLLLHNSNAGDFGGMYTAIEVAAQDPPPTGDTVGPTTSDLNLSDPTGVDRTLTATVDDSATGGSGIQDAEYFLDTVGAEGAGTAADTPGTTSSFTVSNLPTGNHVLYVRGQDGAGNWGPFTSLLVNGGDASGPTTKGASLKPAITNGSVSVAVSATGDDTASGGSNIAQAEFFLEGETVTNGNGHPMQVNNPNAPVASLDGTITPAMLATLLEGSRTISIHSRDAQSPDNWGALATVKLVLDRTAPTTGPLSVLPEGPNNGTRPVNSSIPAVRVSTTISDPITPVGTGVNSRIKKAEMFIDTVGPNGSGIVVAARDGAFDDAVEPAYGDIPLATVRQMSNGPHRLYIHAMDVAGNWGATTSTTDATDLVIDKGRPTVSGVSATPPLILFNIGGGNVTLTASATDAAPGTGITAAEWFTGTDPGVGNGTPMTVSGTGPTYNLSTTINTSSWGSGQFTFQVRARDAAGNWSATGSDSVIRIGPFFFTTLGNRVVPGVGPVSNGGIYGWSGSELAQLGDATPRGLSSNAKVDGFSRVDARHFYVSFSNATTRVRGLGKVQDEDVLYYNNGKWRMFFNGTAHGLRSAGADIDAIDVTRGQLFFSTVGNARPRGVRGAGDDADVYRWNGRTFARVWDASRHRIAKSADVDGVSWKNAKNYALSFGNAGTRIRGLGTVQDEDIVAFDKNGWRVYFDGSKYGLGGSNATDVDDFDIP